MTVMSQNGPAGEQLLERSLASMNRTPRTLMGSNTNEKESMKYQSVEAGVDF